jgi:hypothetical protein
MPSFPYPNLFWMRDYNYLIFLPFYPMTEATLVALILIYGFGRVAVNSNPA